MSESTPKELLRSKKMAVIIQLFEQAGLPSSIRVALMETDSIKDVSASSRAPAITALLAWKYLVQSEIEDPEEATLRVTLEADNDFPEQEEMLKHVEFSLQQFEEHWPHEMAFARSCVFDEMTAGFVVQPFLLHGGFGQNKSLIAQSAPGFVFRAPSPISFFPHPEEEVEQPTNIIISTEELTRILGRNPLSPKPPPDFHFPES